MLRHTTLMATSVAAVTLSTPLVDAHDSWINKGGYRNAVGEGRCGEFDWVTIPI
jgi:hypothetical protein